MTRLELKAAVIVAICYLTAQPAILLGDGFIDSGLENYALNSGGFVMPNSGNWTFGNDAGVVEPYSPNSSTGLLHTWSATFAAIEGQQYASTYAGADQIRQGVSLSTAGDYRISVYAAASEGTVAIRPGDTPLALQDGEFTFTLAGVHIGDLNTVVKGSGWNKYDAVFTIEKPGVYQLGILNTKTAPYFINYDSFSLQPVPEPSTLAMLLSVVLGGLLWWRRRA